MLNGVAMMACLQTLCVRPTAVSFPLQVGLGRSEKMWYLCQALRSKGTREFYESRVSIAVFILGYLS